MHPSVFEETRSATNPIQCSYVLGKWSSPFLLRPDASHRIGLGVKYETSRSAKPPQPSRCLSRPMSARFLIQLFRLQSQDK
ncbi:hypothetical protein K435DRAFT_773687 [Dendrothele bispora CBS 962.96]|uniref:Uncharacterized protein n=1 Tax=Dendrothele bispora (strain CBS 962.96) TaxID=1314807 RepID=A0A4S8MS26_DENBC|nr:hypothetical protein K435DRAFT_773687 [Dendrothele bispora CBS 962.96]